MDELYAKLQKESLVNYGKNVEERKALALARDARLKKSVDELTLRIEAGSVAKMISASEKGYFSCRLFECKTTDMWNEDFRTVFLLRGPSRWINPVSFFELKNIESVECYLGKKLNPIEVQVKYDRHSQTHCVVASWKTIT